MSQAYPPPQRDPVLQYEIPSPFAPNSSPTVGMICWALIFAIVGMTLYSTLPAAPATAGGVAAVPSNPTLPLLGRYIIGTHALLKSGKSSDPLAPLIQQLDDTAKSPADRLRVAIIGHEVESKEAADKRFLAATAGKHSADFQHDAETLQNIYREGPQSIGPSDANLLEQNFGWFGKLALTYGLPDTDPARAKLIAQGRRTIVVLMVAGIGGGAVLVIGFALLVLAIVLGTTGRLRINYLPNPANNLFLEAFAIYLVGFLALSAGLHLLISRFAPHTTSIAWTLLLTPVPAFAMLWPVLRGQSFSQTLFQLGWHRGQGVLREIGSGLVGYITALPLLAITLLIALGLSRLVGATPTHPIINFLNGGPGQVILMYVIACVWAPVIEETMFRGALFGHLRGRHRWWFSAPIVGFIFAAVHPQGWTLIPALGGIGIVLCGLREWRGSLLAPIAAHALNNGTIMTLLVLTMR